LWDVAFVMGGQRTTKPEPELFDVRAKEFTLPELAYEAHEEAFDELELIGFPMCSPFELLQQPPDVTLRSADLKDHIGKPVTIIGYLIHVKHTPTSKGERMHFGVFLDLDGQWLDTVHFPPVARKHPFQGPGCYRITGKVVEEFEFVSIEVSKLERLAYVSLDNTPARLKPVDSYGRRGSSHAVIASGTN
jgi:DNA polymerase-3 subunit alpha